MKTKAIRFAAFLCAALTTAAAAASCAQTSTDPVETVGHTDTQAVETTADPADRTAIKDNLPADLDFGGRTFTVYFSCPTDQNDFMGGVEEQTGDLVEDAVFNRNAAVEDRLNIDLVYNPRTELTGGTLDAAVSKLLMAGDTSQDVFAGQQHGMTKLLTGGGLVTAEDLGSIDLDQPWWWSDYMDELTMGSSGHYFLVGDYFMDALRFTRAVLYNKDLYAQYYDNGDGLYELVLDGKWTIDRMAQCAKDVYVDLNNNGESDEEDQLGCIFWLRLGSTDPFIYSTDIEFTKRDKDGYLTLNMISDDAVKLCEQLVDFFWQPGIYAGCTSDEQQASLYASGRVLFSGNSNLKTAELLRDMKSSFGYLPYPKFDEEQAEYRSLVHDAGMIGAVSGCSLNLDIAGAVMEALCAETYRSVTPVWYETALKIKYTRDDISAQMIDLIHGSITTNFIYAYNYALADIGLQYRTLITNRSTDYVSQVEKNLKAAEKALQTLTDVFSGANQ